MFFPFFFFFRLDVWCVLVGPWLRCTRHCTSVCGNFVSREAVLMPLRTINSAQTLSHTNIQGHQRPEMGRTGDREAET